MVIVTLNGHFHIAHICHLRNHAGIDLICAGIAKGKRQFLLLALLQYIIPKRNSRCDLGIFFLLPDSEHILQR